MKGLGKRDFDKDTSILYTSSFNYSDIIIELVNNGYEVITSDNYSNLFDIPFGVLNRLDCLYLLKKKDLTKIDNIKINILNALSTKNSKVVFFNVLTYVDDEFKRAIIKEFKIMHKVIINFTMDIEEVLLFDYLIVVHDVVIMEGNTKDVLKEEKVLKKLGYSLPFIIELSNGLKYYNLVDKTYYDCESLVDDLWK